MPPQCNPINLCIRQPKRDKSVWIKKELWLNTHQKAFKKKKKKKTDQIKEKKRLKNI